VGERVKSLGEIVLEVARGDGSPRTLTAQEIAGIKTLLAAGTERVRHSAKPCGCGFVDVRLDHFQVTTCPEHEAKP
jgi:hypothetical protein